MANYPEHNKLQARRQESLTVSEFLDFLRDRGLHIAKYHEHGDQCEWSERDLICDNIFSHHIHGERCYRERVARRCGLGDEVLYDHDTPRNEELIGLFLDIDPKKLSAEKSAMVDELRANANKAA
jgi:hypothetical protein